MSEGLQKDSSTEHFEVPKLLFTTLRWPTDVLLSMYINSRTPESKNPGSRLRYLRFPDSKIPWTDQAIIDLNGHPLHSLTVYYNFSKLIPHRSITIKYCNMGFLKASIVAIGAFFLANILWARCKTLEMKLIAVRSNKDKYDRPPTPYEHSISRKTHRSSRSQRRSRYAV